MNEPDGLAEQFQAHRRRLRSVAYRMLGSTSEAEDAVQEAWLRLCRTDAGELQNLGGWLHTVVTRICLDLLRSRRSRREDVADPEVLDRFAGPGGRGEPEDEALMADAVSSALMVVLDTLSPTERVAFVLHDMFAVPFDQIATIVERTPTATKKIASRARGKVRGTPALPPSVLDGHRQIVATFLAAARSGDLDAILAVLAPNVVRRLDPALLPPGGTIELRGAQAVAEGTVAFADRSRIAEPALVDGRVGVVVAVNGLLMLALTFAIEDDQIAGYEVIADPDRLQRLEIAVPDWPAM